MKINQTAIAAAVFLTFFFQTVPQGRAAGPDAQTPAAADNDNAPAAPFDLENFFAPEPEAFVQTGDELGEDSDFPVPDPILVSSPGEDMGVQIEAGGSNNQKRISRHLEYLGRLAEEWILEERSGMYFLAGTERLVAAIANTPAGVSISYFNDENVLISVYAYSPEGNLRNVERPAVVPAAVREIRWR